VAAEAPTGATAQADHLIGVLRTLADPTRLRLFLALRAKERCVSDLVASEGLPQPLVSHHLRVLARAGLVQARRADGFTLYAVDADGMAAARSAAMNLLDPEAITPLAQPGGNPDCCR
jgi:ArsR family transcriptional regulator